MTHRVVVGVDGSTNADRALAWALRYAGRANATLVIASAWDWEDVVGVPGARFPTESQEEAERRAHAVIDDSLARVSDQMVGAVAIERTIGRGPAQALLLEHAKDADLLVVGTRGRGGVAGLLLGSVSQYCVTHAACPTVVVPLSPDQATGQEAA